MLWKDECLGVTLPPLNLEVLTPFMFCVEKKNKALEEMEAAPTPETKIDKLTSVKNCEDVLFWSIYLAVNGDAEYNRAWNTTNVEMEEKTKIAQTFFENRNNIKSLVDKKLTKVACGKIAESVQTKPKLSIEELPAVSLYYNIDIYLVNEENKTYVSCTKPNPTNTVILYKRGPKYFIEYCQSKEELLESFIHISDEKPFKAIGNYKVDDLEMIASITGYKFEKPILKKVLYENLMVHCMWK